MLRLFLTLLLAFAISAVSLNGTSTSSTNGYRFQKTGTELGRGGFGVVYLARSNIPGYPYVALKCLSKSTSPTEMDMEYRYQAAASQSEFVLKVFGIATMDGQKCMVLEYADLGDMSDYLFKKMGRPLMENEAKGIYWRLASGLAYLHRAGLAHRDIKLQNFLVAGAQRLPKIADFGLSVFTDKRDLAAKRNQRCGTPGYMAPEMAKPEVLKDVTKVDVYALGASYRMGLTGEAAPQRFTDTNPKWQALSPQARDLITGMMRPDPDQRPTMQQVLQHPWLRRN